VDISNESIRCLLIDPRAALVIMRPGDVFEASVFNVSEKGMRRVIGPGLGWGRWVERAELGRPRTYFRRANPPV
jgi:hypothetical protein